MEASEKTGLRREVRGDRARHRVDLNRVAGTLSEGGNAAGFARLNLMVTTVFDRLVAGDGQGLSEP
jgi:hypothetical protein